MRICHLHRWFLILPILLLSGCESYRDISHDPRYPTDYAVGAVYRLKQPVLVEKDWSLHRPQPIDMSIAEHERDPDFLKWYVGVARPGTQIQVTKMRHEQDVNATGVWITGRLLNGPWEKRPVELYFISRHVPCDATYALPVVDKNVLELVRKP